MKAVVINNLAEQLNEYPHFYLTDIETLNAEQTAQLRRKCLDGLSFMIIERNSLALSTICSGENETLPIDV